MCQRISEKAKPADLYYVTNSDSKKDHYYFDLISREFGHSEYHVLSSSVDILKFILKLRRHWLGSTMYDYIYVANHTLSHFRYLLKIHPEATVRTFDEGSGNFDPIGALHNDRRSKLERMRDLLLGAPSIQEVFGRSEIHYTVRAKLANVVPSHRLVQVDLLREPNRSGLCEGVVQIVVGQPVEEYLSAHAVKVLMSAYSYVTSGQYLVHPRETEKSIYPKHLERVLDERILEHYISDLVANGLSVRLIGPFSTSFLTLDGSELEKHYLHISTNPNFPDLAAQAGCEVYDLRHPSGIYKWEKETTKWK